MTKTEAIRRTREHLRFGYFQDSGPTAHVFCPECREPVFGTYLPWEKPTPALRTALITHLTDEH